MEKPKKRLKSPILSEKAAQLRVALSHPSRSFIGDVDRTIDEIRTRQNVDPQPWLRKAAFSMGLLPDIRPTAEYIANLGCSPPFISPNVVRSYFRVLDKYGVEFTVLDDEVCCGWLALEPAVVQEDWTGAKKAEEACKEFVKENVDAAIAKGARNLLHFCEWCVYLYKWAHQEGAFGEEGQKVGQLTLLSPIFDRLDRVKLRMKKPTVIGYYEGCHLRTDIVLPDVKLDWSPYRQVMDRIENAEVIDLPNTCCLTGAEKVIEAAKKRKVDAIVCRCYPCSCYLYLVSKEAVPIKFIPEILDEASEP